MNILSKTLSCLLIGIFMLVSTSCATLTSDIEVETHAEIDINVNAYKTYAWASDAEILFDPIGQWEQPTLDTDEEVRFLVNRELRAWGINQVKSHPDLLVAYAAGIDTTALDLQLPPDSKSKTLQRVPKAALMIALVDANTGYLIWYGYAEGEVQQQRSIDDIRARIDYAVTEIFKSFGN